MKKAIATLLLTVSMSAYSVEHTFSNEQLDNLQYAYAFGEQFQKTGKFKDNETRYDNNGLGYIMAGLLWQESSAGINTGISKDKHHAYGMFQNYLPTLRNRVKQIGWKLSDKEIINMIQKRSNSATWAYIELSYWLEQHNGDMRKSLASYNAGWNVKAGNKYASEVLTKSNYLKSNKMLQQRID
ncbi:Vs.1 conserved hypothetical protein [Yersinia phage phiR1-RT]|uniref:Site-specific RNA endonuclease n=2 Tax=Tegunavirus TaxID=1921704 RepID=A0A0B4ZZH2_9CAUD|nr:hypothetical protein BN80_114 [Yersinia phage phiR1-RT]YP_009200379.1 hypothetical protein AVV33_gp118 [Yersinia phage vB_YenM_TG1]AJD81928.1 site-specific RNA endonuclease [Yersinia phage vB_YenM_TG1]CCI88688.1 Vs.1 conserved hypothetical protein [Yersinia phage phiR1-RT]